MNTRKTLTAALVLAAGLTGTAQAALQGRDLNGSAGSFEAYYDTDLDITWLADANYGAGSIYDNGSIPGDSTGGSTTDGLMKWDNANAWVANLSFTDGVNVYDDWRLPTVEPVNGTSFNYNRSYNGSTDNGYNITSPQSEMAYMYYVNLGNLAAYNSAGESSGCYVAPTYSCLDNVGPFSNIQPYVYWSGTEHALADAWFFHMAGGGQDGFEISQGGHAWAVSSGDVAITGVPVAVPEADTWTMLLAGLGLVGTAVRRRRG